VPAVKVASVGSSLGVSGSSDDEELLSKEVGFERVFVARADKHGDGVAIQRALNEGLDVVLSPGVFELHCTLTLKHEGQVLLGIGMATLVAPSGEHSQGGGRACVKVLPRVPGVRVAGVMLQASSPSHLQATQQGGDDDDDDVDTSAAAAAPPSSTLLEWGDLNDSSSDPGDPLNPGVLSDVFCRVGGPDLDRSTIAVHTMVPFFLGSSAGSSLFIIIIVPSGMLLYMQNLTSLFV